MIQSSASLETTIAILACCRLGITHNVIFEDLKKSAIIKRLKIFKPDLFIAKTNENNLNDHIIPAINNYNKISIICLDRIYLNKKNITYININYINNNFSKKNNLSFFRSTKDLFVLFTSGSTGVPKGIVHSTGGYLTYIKYTCKNFFGYNANSVVFTASDAGWINGHTYAVYGPLMFGATSVLIENPMRLVDEKILSKIIKDLKITILYLPVTLIKILKSLNIKKITHHKILTIGSMGEPLAPKISKWYINFFNPKNKVIINTYFQTETGGILIAPKFDEDKKYFDHGSVGKIKNFVGLKINNKDDDYVDNELSLIYPWPGCMKNVLNGKKVWNKYFDKNNNFRLFDIGVLNKNSNLFIQGRTDDVINIRGHRIGSAEVESLLLQIDNIIEASAIGVEDELEGYVFILFLVIKNKTTKIENLVKKILKDNFGSYALPQKIFILNELPKTKSGKILRRLLRDIYSEEFHKKNDFSTINKTGLIEEIANIIKIQNSK